MAPCADSLVEGLVLLQAPPHLRLCGLGRALAGASTLSSRSSYKLLTCSRFRRRAPYSVPTLSCALCCLVTWGISEPQAPVIRSHRDSLGPRRGGLRARDSGWCVRCYQNKQVLRAFRIFDLLHNKLERF